MAKNNNFFYIGIAVAIGSGIGLIVSMFFGGSLALGIIIGGAIGLLKETFWKSI